MATGKRAFERGTTAETLTAIIREEPAPVAQLNPRVPAPIRWLLERCSAKIRKTDSGRPRISRGISASVRDHLSDTSFTGDISPEVAAVAPKRRIWPVVAGLGLLLAGAAVGLFAGAVSGRHRSRASTS
jgi:hypothetical protein